MRLAYNASSLDTHILLSHSLGSGIRGHGCIHAEQAEIEGSRVERVISCWEGKTKVVEISRMVADDWRQGQRFKKMLDQSLV